jgi:hypothetical protein
MNAHGFYVLYSSLMKAHFPTMVFPDWANMNEDRKRFWFDFLIACREAFTEPITESTDPWAKGNGADLIP